MKVPEYSISAVLILIAIILVVTLGNFNLIMLLVSGGSFFITVSLTKSVMFATISGVVALLTMSMYMKRGEGFRTRGLQPDISSRIQNMKANKKSEEKGKTSKEKKKKEKV
jgi:membrane-bound ClpP family serine protease